MERTFDLKSAKVDSTRQKCKEEGISREETKDKVKEAEKAVAVTRKKGTKELKQFFNEILEDDDLSLREKLQFFKEHQDEIREKIDDLLQS